MLSEASSRLTFPELTDFRVVRIQGYRRVFQHPGPIFFHRGIADLSTKRICSLSAEPAPAEVGFNAVVFKVSGTLVDFIVREEEFDLEMVPYCDLESGEG